MYLLRSKQGRRAISVLYHNVVSKGSASHSSGATAVPNRELHFYRHYAKLVTFPLAQTGEGISECELVAWAVKAGDVVAPFDKLCDVQSDKAAIEITSRYGGRVVALHHAVGALVKVGAPLVDLEVADDEQVASEHLANTASPSSSSSSASAPAAHAAAASASAAPAPAAATDRTSAAATASTVTATMVASMTPVTPATAAPLEAAKKVAAAAAVAAVPSPSSSPSPSPSPSPPASQLAGVPVHASPAVRALARELGIDLATVVGSGPGGRVTKPDLIRHRDELLLPGHQQQLQPPPAAGAASATATAAPSATFAVHLGDAEAPSPDSPHPPPPRPQRALAEVLAHYQRLTATPAAGAAAAGAAAAAGGGHVVPLRGYRRAMVKSMTAAAALPLFHFHDEVVMDRLVAVRAALRADPGLKAQGIRLTVLPLLLKALSTALLQHPHLNASLGANGTELVVHSDHNIGVAMATPAGLVVPNIKQVQRKSVVQVAAELSLLQQLAAAGKVPPEALAGGTISVSNIGTIGGTYATPLVTPPEVAIVALGRLQVLPRYPPATAAGGGGNHHQAPVPVSVMPVSWGADHRVVDGAALAAFSNTWKELLERPERLLLSLA